MRPRAQITTAATTLTNATHMIALTGAGMSVESGIPPFRGAGGLWTKHGEPPMDGYQRFMADPAAHWRNMLARRDSDDEFTRALNAAKPNAGHLAMAELERMGVLKHTICQNIDNLHFEAGSMSVTEIHGNRTKLRCVECTARWPWAEFTMTDIPPACPHCGGMVKSDTVMFGEPIPRQFLAECQAQAERADCIMIVGTSASVTPAAWFPEIVLERGGTLIEINTEPTPFSSHCAASIRAPSGEALPLIVDEIHRMQRLEPGD
ncbi:MAG: Sir2 family NAD-dependent protein deacetylase [Dehalococcoidia bacterium]